jgi:hypothetical protein
VLDDGAERDAFVFARPDGTRIEPNGRNCFRGNILATLGAVSSESVGSAVPEPSVITARAGDAPSLLALNRAAGLAIDWQTARCGWLGERIDYGLAIEALIQRRNMTRAASATVAASGVMPAT